MLIPTKIVNILLERWNKHTLCWAGIKVGDFDDEADRKSDVVIKAVLL